MRNQYMKAISEMTVSDAIPYVNSLDVENSKEKAEAFLAVQLSFFKVNNSDELKERLVSVNQTIEEVKETMPADDWQEVSKMNKDFAEKVETCINQTGWVALDR